jgi:SAM-dependent methyltransferase
MVRSYKGSLVPNEFSPTWYSLFMDTMPTAAGEAETAFVARHLPPAQFPRLLDLCCGSGRHAARFAAHGYHVLGVDQKAAAIARARQLGLPGCEFAVYDMRDVAALPHTFDGVVNLWHSFGYFDDRTNADILRQIHGKLRPGGRFVLDIYNRDALERAPATQHVEKEGVAVSSTYTWQGKRLRCELRYGDGSTSDTFEWRLYTPREIQQLAEQTGFHCIVGCAWFDERIAPSAEHTRMQWVFERGAEPIT